MAGDTLMVLRLLTIATTIVALLYLALLAGMYTAQRRFLFRPDGTRVAPAAAGLPQFAEVTLDTPDGEQLVAWHSPPKPGKKTILYFHGNAGNIAGRRDRLEAYQLFGFGVLILGYRGSSGSTGSVSEATYVADAKLSYEWLRGRAVATGDIVLYGESLGTGVAVRTAAENQVGGLILDAPYTAVVDVAASRYWFLPVRLLLSDPFPSLELMPRIKAPLLIIHGAKDTIIPIAMGRAIFAAANEPKQMIEYPEAGHIFHSQYGSLGRVREFVDGLPSTR